MFKNLTVYRIAAGWDMPLAQIEASLQKLPFVDCGATQTLSMGWVEPRGKKHGALAESVGGQLLLKLMVEKKLLPASVVKRKTEDRLQHIEATEGQRPGKKQTKEIKEEVMLDLLPKAFSKHDSVGVWIDPKQRMLLVDAGSQARADEVVTFLVKSLEGLSVALLQTTGSAAAAMSEWLSTREAPAGFSIDRECELKSADETKSVVRYARHTLDIDEVRLHISEGKQPTRLAMTWADRISFVLTETTQIKRLQFLDVVFQGGKASKDDGFDADAAISTGELAPLIAGLVEALGGEMRKEMGQEIAPQ